MKDKIILFMVLGSMGAAGTAYRDVQVLKLQIPAVKMNNKLICKMALWMAGSSKKKIEQITKEIAPFCIRL